MKKTIYEVIMKAAAEELEKIELDLISAEQRQSVKEETGEIEKFSKYEVEVPRGNGELSRIRFTVKVLEENLKVNPEKLEEESAYVRFSGLTISYIDQKRNMYFKAGGIIIVKGDQ